MVTRKNLIKKEEIANAISHGVGLALSFAALSVLVVKAANIGTAWHIVSFSIYGLSLITLYLASTLYHSAKKVRIKWKLNKFDHSAIYVLIAGTYTPYTLIVLRGTIGWIIFGIVWTLAIGGIIYKTFFYSQKYRTISAIVYILMGWVVLIGIKPLVHNLPAQGLFWLGLGGIVYTVGVIFYIIKKLPYSHTIWHLFVLAGSICHFISILLYVR